MKYLTSLRRENKDLSFNLIKLRTKKGHYYRVSIVHKYTKRKKYPMATKKSIAKAIIQLRSYYEN